jgi:5,10-methylenetetrahydromethanopterin reductase
MLTDHATAVSLPRNLPADRIVDFARSAERLGFDELWIVEDCFFRGGIAQASVALATTSTIHVGIGILPAAARNAAFATLEANTLAELFPGRTTIGVGHGMPGWMRQVGAWPASPLTMLEETISAMRALLAGETLSVEGRYVRLRDVGLENPAPTPPLVLAGVRGPRSLEVSGRVADGTVLAEPVTPEYLAAVLRQVDASRPHRVVAYNVAAVHPDASVARDLAHPAQRAAGDGGHSRGVRRDPARRMGRPARGRRHRGDRPGAPGRAARGRRAQRRVHPRRPGSVRGAGGAGAAALTAP